VTVNRVEVANETYHSFSSSQLRHVKDSKLTTNRTHQSTEDRIVISMLTWILGGAALICRLQTDKSNVPPPHI